MHAEAIDVHLSEDRTYAVLDVVNQIHSFTVTLTYQALVELRDRISRALSA
ncbi:MAG TPA: hypothetical protein VG939_20670 [Caulobacteraceae bacterium]|nr:hypothetical protein [Caulobacteraceae bacterium]